MADNEQILVEKPSLVDGVDFTSLKINPEEAFLLSRVDGQTTVKQLSQLIGKSPAATLVLLEGLVGAGAVTVPGIKAAPAPPPPAPPSEASPPSSPTPAPALSQAAVPLAAGEEDEFLETEFDDEEPAAPQPSTAAASPSVSASSAAAPASPAPRPAATHPAPTTPAPVTPTRTLPDHGAPERQGTFADVPLAQILTDFAEEQRTGVLRLSNQERGAKDVYLSQGLPVVVDSNVLVEKECLGRLLKFAGKISDADVAHSLETMRETNRRQGEVLLEMGSITPQELDVALRWQVEIKLAEAFSWPAGQWRFFPRKTLPPEYPNFKVNLAAFLHKSINRGMPIAPIEKALTARMQQFVTRKQSAVFTDDAYGFTPREKKFVAAIDGTTTIRQLGEASGMPMENVMRLVFLLWTTGAVELREAKGAGGHEARILEELEARYDEGRTCSVFDRLGVHWTSPQSVIDHTHAKNKELYGPSGKYRDAKYRREIQELAEKIYKQAAEAYAAVSDERKRRQERENLHDRMKIEQSADMQYQRTETLFFWREDFAEAAATMESAADLVPGNALYKGMWGAALMCQHHGRNKKESDRGRQIMERALRAASQSDVMQYTAGFAYATCGRKSAARKALQAALAVNPKNNQAARLLRRLGSGG